MPGIGRSRWALVIAAAMASAGCMTVHLDSGGAPVGVVRHFGVLHVELPRPGAAVVGELSGTGIAATPLGWSAGYTRQRWAAIGPQCRAVVWLADGRIDEPTRSRLSALSGVCLIDDTSVRSAAPITVKEEVR